MVSTAAYKKNTFIYRVEWLVHQGTKAISISYGLAKLDNANCLVGLYTYVDHSLYTYCCISLCIVVTLIRLKFFNYL